MRVNFWIATTVATNELWHWEHAADAWCDYTQAAGIGKRRLGLSFVEDRSGNLWIGTGSEENDGCDDSLSRESISDFHRSGKTNY